MRPGLAALRVGTRRPRFLRSPLFIALPTWRARKPRVSLGDPGRGVAAGQGTSSGILEDVAPLSRDNRLLGHLHGTGVPPVRRRGHPLEPGCPRRELHSCGSLCVPAAPGVWSEPPCSAQKIHRGSPWTLCSLGSVGYPARGCLFAQGGQPVVKRRRHPVSYLTLALFKVGAQSRSPDPEDFS